MTNLLCSLRNWLCEQYGLPLPDCERIFQKGFAAGIVEGEKRAFQKFRRDVDEMVEARLKRGWQEMFGTVRKG